MLETTPQSASEIRRKMQAIRLRMDNDLSEVVSNAKQLVDWRYYFRRSPWISLGLASAVGYLAVPKTPRTLAPDEATRKALAKSDRWVVQQQTGGWTSSVLGLLIPVVLRLGIGHVSQLLSRDRTGTSDNGDPYMGETR